jgi:hypothetical protein
MSRKLSLTDRIAIGVAGTALVTLGWLGPLQPVSGAQTGSQSLRTAPRALSAHQARIRHAHNVHVAEVRKARAEYLTNLHDAWMVAVASRVSVCEEGLDWSFSGPVYSGGLGFLWATWDQFKTRSDPANMANATPLQQARALFALVDYYGIAMPDQHGCSGGY